MNFGRTEWSQFLFPLKLESQPQEGSWCSRHREDILPTSRRDADFKPCSFEFGRFHFSWKFSGGMFCRDAFYPEKAIFSFNSSSFPRKAKSYHQPPTSYSSTPGKYKPKPQDRSCWDIDKVFLLVGSMEAGLLHSRCSDSLGVVLIWSLELPWKEHEGTGMSSSFGERLPPAST